MQKVSLVLRHYNKLKPISCTVVSGNTDKLFTIELNDNEGKGLDMLKGDPILIGGLNKDDTVYVSGGSVVGVTQQEDKYIICSDEIVYMPKEIDKRQNERYPTSLLGEIKLVNSNKRERLYLKNFSYSGMGVYSDGEFEVNDSVEISIYLSNAVLIYDGIVIRRAMSYGRNEYGLRIIHRDKNALYNMQTQLSSIMQSEKELIYKHLLNSNFKI